MGIVVGIDASRNRSGGAKAHLTGLLTEGDPMRWGISKIHLWTYRALSDSLEEKPYLVKHSPEELDKSLGKQLWWQANRLSREVAAAGCQILFTTDATSLCSFKPSVVLSQDMLSYEPGVMKLFGITKARLRLLAILYLQNRAFKAASGVIFLTHYAARVIQESCGLLKRIAYIPHGIGRNFKQSVRLETWPTNGERPIRCIYVSNAAMYKHQWVLVRAIATLRKKGHNLKLLLVGGGSGKAQILLNDAISIYDSEASFVRQSGFVSQNELPRILTNSDLFVFTSSCENLPVSLLEAMAAGLPIACSDRGPMPEILADGGVYFDPEDYESIAFAIETLLNDSLFRERIANRAKHLSEQYTWSRCADETWKFIAETYRSVMS
jgi:glycosyltransferase involved in cell wall biosynthesis